MVELNGILLLDKPQGLSSNQALQKVKRVYQASKAGHSGSLDPLATGMLPICLGEATKLCSFMLEEDKAYEVRGVLGVETTTEDAMGDVIAQVHGFELSKELLEETLKRFRGAIYQVPPMYSALKHQGKPLYKLAREGKEVKREPRLVSIYDLNLLAFDGVSFSLRVSCSKGTYIRTLVKDIGKALGVGAHVAALRRVYTAGFESKPMVTLEALSTLSEKERLALLLPLDEPLLKFPALNLNEDSVLALRQGKRLQGFGLPSEKREERFVRLYTHEGLFFGIGSMSPEGILSVKRLLRF